MATSRKFLPPLFTLAILVTLSGWAQPRECVNSPVLFSDDSYRGRELQLRDSVSDLHSQGMGDDASSVCVPSGWRVILYEDTNFGGDTLELRGPVTISDLKRERPQGQNWGDRVSAVRVYEPRRRLGRYQGRLPRDCDQYPVLFERDTFRGDTARLDRSVSDLHRQGMGDDASSVCVPDGWRVVLFENDNYRGDRLEVYGPDAIQDLKRDRPGGRDWGDRISSARVEQFGGYRRRPNESGGVFKDDFPGNLGNRCGRYPTLYAGSDYRGRRLELNDSVNDLRRRGFGETVGSLCVPAGYSVSIYEGTDYRGRSFEISGDRQIPNLRRARPGYGNWGDRIGSVRVYRSGRGSPDPHRPGDSYGSLPCRDYPEIYSDDGYRGASMELTRSIRNLHNEGFGDAASSVCVPHGWVIVLYADTDFRGDYLEVSGGRSISDLGRDRPGGRDWGDQVSSVEVRRGWR